MSVNGRRLKLAGYWISQLDKPVLWAAKGSYVVDPAGLVVAIDEDSAFDCSGLVTCGLLRIGAPDHRADWSAQRLANEMPITDKPELGDLGFYGKSWDEVVHVVGCLEGGHVISADGATSKIRTLAEAQKSGARVRVHQGVAYRVGFLGFRSNTYCEERP